MSMNWKFFAVMAPITIASTVGGYFHGGEDEALRYFLLSLLGCGAGYCVGRLLTKGR